MFRQVPVLTCAVFLAALRPVAGDEVKERIRLDGEQRVETLAFAPDGKKLLSAHAGGRVYLWDVSKGKRVSSFALTGYAILSVTFSTDGTAFAALGVKGVSAPGIIRVWDSASGKEKATVKPPQALSDTALALGPGGKLLAFSGRGERDPVVLWDIVAGKQVARCFLNRPGDSKPVTRLAFSPNGKKLAVAGYGIVTLASPYEIRLGVFDVSDSARPKQIGKRVSGGCGRVPALLFAPGGDEVMAVGDSVPEGTSGPWVLVVEAATGKLARSHSLKSGVVNDDLILALCCPARGLVVALEVRKSVEFLDGKSGKALGKLKPQGWTLAVSPDGKTMAAVDEDGSIRLYDVERLLSPR